jgi:GNAT superfamily N-acetyltransferase
VSQDSDHDVRTASGASRGVTDLDVNVYPEDLERDVTTTTGLSLHLRPIRPSDAESLVAFHQGLSPAAVYRRYFSWHPELSAKEVSRYTNLDYVERLALVVTDGDALVAVGRYDHIPDTRDAEVAFLVADKYQHQGIGLLLLHNLAGAARARGITSFSAETQADNRNMMNVFRESGFHVRSTIDAEVLSVRFSIEPDEPDRSATMAEEVATAAAVAPRPCH